MTDNQLEEFANTISEWNGKDYKKFLKTTAETYNAMGYGLMTLTKRSNGDLRIKITTHLNGLCERILYEFHASEHLEKYWKSAFDGGIDFFQIPAAILGGRKQTRRKKKPEDHVFDYYNTYIIYHKLIALLHLDGMLYLNKYKHPTEKDIIKLKSSISIHLYKDKDVDVEIKHDRGFITIGLPVMPGYEKHEFTLEVDRLKEPGYMKELANAFKSVKFTHRPLWNGKDITNEVED